jgi:hypothetical protein
MKKIIFMILSVICWVGCTDTSVDTTVMPPVTATGANTFGCLIDGWVYVGGRYNVKNSSQSWTLNSFYYNSEEDKFSVHVSVKEDVSIRFTIPSPKEGKESAITDIYFGSEELEDGTIFISRLDTDAGIISGTFENNQRLTKGRLDIHYITSENEQ